MTMEAAAQAPLGAAPDPKFEVIVGPDGTHPVNAILVSLDRTLGTTVTFTLRDPDTDYTFNVEVKDLEADFDGDRGHFVVSGTRTTGGRVNGHISTRPIDGDVVGSIRISL